MTRALALVLLCACSSGPQHRAAPESPTPPASLFAIPDRDAGALDAGDVGAALDASGFAGNSAPSGFPDAGRDAGEPLDAGDVAAAPDAGLDAAPAPNACGGFGPITCGRPPCKPGAQCATIAGCAANVCVDCPPSPGADLQCAESQCGGSWAWECAGANVLRCTNGRFQC